jgi:hypothetical protein
MKHLGMRSKDDILADEGIPWRAYMAIRVAALVAQDPTLTPVQRFDILTTAGFKLNLVTGVYYWPK